METGTSWSGLLITLAIAVVTGLASLIGVLASYLSRRFDHKLKMKSLTDEINRYVGYARSSDTYKLMANEDRINALLEQVRLFAEQNSIVVTDFQLISMIESSMAPLLSLENRGIKFMKLKGEIK